jgi:acetylornithine deacetylase/succinyl-diaminopimelate desuccinylase-like protein
MHQPVIDFLHSHRTDLIEDLRTLLRQPSVATENHGMLECAQLLARQMESFGMTVEWWETAGFPALYSRIEGTGDRTLLIYGHYDVQPANEVWIHDPWGAVIEDGKLYGRGAVDDKGAVMAALEGVRAYLATGTPLPCTVIFFIEGEEEIGSPNLAPVMRARADQLRADAVANFDDNVWPDGRPRVVVGVKGTTKLRIEANRPREFHGMMAPIVQNALWRLIEGLSTLRTPDGQITIDDFFDDVRDPTPTELEALRLLPWDGKDILRISGQKEFVGGLTGLDALTQLYLKPSCSVTGLAGGYIYPMRKSVVPNHGVAELDFRTVPNQTGERILQLVQDHLARRGFDDLKVELISEMNHFRCSLENPVAEAMGNAIRGAFGVEPAKQPTYPGCGPEPLFAELLGIYDHAYSGFGPTEDRLHAPNEYIEVETYLKGAECVARLIDEYGTIYD